MREKKNLTCVGIVKHSYLLAKAKINITVIQRLCVEIHVNYYWQISFKKRKRKRKQHNVMTVFIYNLIERCYE